MTENKGVNMRGVFFNLVRAVPEINWGHYFVREFFSVLKVSRHMK
ncbi:hypothetical protein [Pseudomonas kilonensis]